MQDPLLVIKDLDVSLQGKRVLKNIDLTIRKGEQWAVSGDSGSGKTVLAHTLAGRHFFSGTLEAAFDRPGGVAVVDQQHRFKDLTNQNSFYYQQRFNSFDAENTITVRAALMLTGSLVLPGAVEDWVDLFRIDHLLDEPLIQLSNGENKRLQLVKALVQEPALLVLDQPFVGLDVEGRENLSGVLEHLIQKGLPIILLSSSHELPGWITHVALLKEGELVYKGDKKDFAATLASSSARAIDIGQLKKIFSPRPAGFATAIRMVDVNIRYDQKQVLQNFNWEVKAGEHWSVSGPNGSGKSTLLSLVTADNPQAYANEIYLFDRRRGTGESIWDIKQKIGFVSPELHLYFDSTATGFQTVASGLFDTVGLFRTVSRNQESIVLDWMHWLGLSSLRNQLLSRLPLGQQRLLLLARALIKHPPVLILDEPCQGLDDHQIEYFIQLIDAICNISSTTLIYVSHYESELPGCIDHHLRLPVNRF